MLNAEAAATKHKIDAPIIIGRLNDLANDVSVECIYLTFEKLGHVSQYNVAGGYGDSQRVTLFPLTHLAVADFASKSPAVKTDELLKDW